MAKRTGMTAAQKHTAAHKARRIARSGARTVPAFEVGTIAMHNAIVAGIDGHLYHVDAERGVVRKLRLGD